MNEKDRSVPIDAEFLAEMDGAFIGWGDPAQRLRKALAGNELRLYMQPIANLAERRFVMAEVLVKLHEEETKMLPPGEFLLVFEQYGMMPDLDRWVVNRLVQRIARGSLKGFRHFSVNVASATLQNFCFPGHVTQTIKIGVIAKFVEEAASWRN